MTNKDLQGADERNPQNDQRLEGLLQRLEVKQHSGDSWRCLCPAHDDKNPSLNVSEGEAGRILVHCFAGCDTEDVLAAIGLEMSVLSGSRSSQPSSPRSRPTTKKATMVWGTLEAAARAAARMARGSVASIHRYEDLAGDVSFATVRINIGDDKTFRPFRLEDDGWHLGKPDRALPLYHLPRLLPAEDVLVVEGERCVEAAERLGIVATTSAHGSKSAHLTDWSHLDGKAVTIWPDNDDPGRRYAEAVVAALQRLAPDAEVRLLAPSQSPDGGDIIDWIAEREQEGIDGSDLEEAVAKLLYDATIPPKTEDPNCAVSAVSARGGPRSTWPPRKPIDVRSKLPAFPIDDVFPRHLKWVKDYVLAIAECHQVPADGVAMLLLPTMALGLAKRFVVQPQPGWSEQLSLYVVVLLPSGERKTAVVRELTKAVYAWQRDVASGMEDELRRIQNEEEIIKSRLSRARNKAATSNNNDLNHVHDVMRSLTDLESSKPTPPHMVVTEGTAEAITEVLSKNNECAMLAAAEGDAFDIMLGRYAGSPNFGVWLAGHSGDPIDSVRRGRDADRLTCPSLQVALCIQPEAVNDLLSSRAAHGRGVLARFFFSMPESKVGFRELAPPPIPPALVDQFGTRMQSNLNVPIPNEPRVITLTSDARELFNAYRQRNETALRPDGDLSLVRSWGSKLPGGLARIAGVLRMFDTPNAHQIDAETMRCALSLHEYLFAHYAHVAVLAGDDETIHLARRIDAWIRKEKVELFTLRDAFCKVRTKNTLASDLEPALQLLEDRDRIRPLPIAAREGPGRPPSPSFQVNPALLETEHPHPQKPQKPHNSAGEGGQS